MKALVNGKTAECIDIYDRGLHYGDGVFETMRASAGRVSYFDRHMRRLGESCERLGLLVPDPELIAGEIGELCADQAQLLLKLMITRGSGPRGYAPAPESTASRIIMSFPCPYMDSKDATDGIAVRSCDLRLGVNPSLAGMKHLNRLEQVLARAEWTDPGIKEGLLFDTDGWLVEAVHSNVFIVRDGTLQTPMLDRCGVAGVIREAVLELSRDSGMSTEVCRISQEDLFMADEIFLSNTVTGVLPVRKVDEQVFVVGPETLKLRTLLEQDRGQ